MLDALARWGYRFAYLFLRVWWWICRPRAQGVAIAVVAEGRLLVVRQSFRTGIGLPAGGRDPDEPPRAAALRELREETALAPEPAALIERGSLELVYEHRTLAITLFEWRPDIRPEIRVDRREIVAFAWMTADELRAVPHRHPSLDWWTARYGDQLAG
jgi:8-oxo-dGTP pyrophosphatase MutT (NUDIX family)